MSESEEECGFSDLESYTTACPPVLFSMPPLPNKPPPRASVFNKLVRRNPALLGVPFICAIVGGSVGLSHLTQMRYDMHDKRSRKVSSCSRHQFTMILTASQMTSSETDELEKLKKRKFDIREEYFVRRPGRPCAAPGLTFISLSACKHRRKSGNPFE